MYKSENLNKIWKCENPRWRPPVTSFIWLLLPWKPIRHHVVSLNWKYKWSLLYVPNFKSIGWIVSKVEGGGGSDWPPLDQSRLRVTIFSRRLLGLKDDFINIWTLSRRQININAWHLGSGLQFKSFYKKCQDTAVLFDKMYHICLKSLIDCMWILLLKY